MYRLAKDVEFKLLEDYGFKKAKDIPFIADNSCLNEDGEDYWLLSMNPDEPEEVLCDDYENPSWSICVRQNRNIWIDCVPVGTYHIDNLDMEEMFYVLRQLIIEGMIEDDF